MLPKRNSRYVLALVAGTLALSGWSQADPIFIAGQDFNGLPSDGAFTDATLIDGSDLTNTGSFNVGGPGLDFSSIWNDTRSTGGGPVTPTSDSSDFIGVNSFAGSNSPNVSPSGVTVASGSEHNFEFNDTDGRIDLIFESVDLSAFTDRSIQFSYWITDTGYESDDALVATIDDGVNAEIFLNLGEAELEGGASADDGSANWNTVFLDLEPLFQQGFGTTLTLTISVDTNAGSENIFVDDILFRSGAEGPNEEPEPALELAIFEIQGAGHESDHIGETVATSGIVTAVSNNGFYLQDPLGDGVDATSDAVLVFTGSMPSVAVGDLLNVVGRVTEFIPGGASTGNLSTTEIIDPEIEVVSNGNALPAPVLIGQGGRLPITEIIDNDGLLSFDPLEDGIDFFESLEGMRVTAKGLMAVSGTNRFGEIFAVVDGGLGASGLSSAGTLSIGPSDFNPERIQIDPDANILPGFWSPEVNAGDLLGDVTGIVGYNFGNFEIIPTVAFEASVSAFEDAATTFRKKKKQLTVASYNVLNLDPNDADGDTDLGDGRFEAVAAHIVANLDSPDIVGLQEIQDGSGSANDGVVSAALTLEALVQAIEDLGGPEYQYIDNPFIEDGRNGGQPGANIRAAFLYNPERVSLVEGSVTSIAYEDQADEPSNPFYDSRLPLVARFEFNGKELTVINNHFSSKGGSAPVFGMVQPFDALQDDPTVNGSVDERLAQATAVAAFVDALLLEESAALVVALGDFNEFQFVGPLADALGGSLENLTFNLPENERYSYIFDGNAQSLDHIFVSSALAGNALYEVVHLNAALAESSRLGSDHDPVIAQLTIEKKEPRIKLPKWVQDLLRFIFGGRDLPPGLARLLAFFI